MFAMFGAAHKRERSFVLLKTYYFSLVLPGNLAANFDIFDVVKS
jgi:hypothetical protein